jgi:hypothetical protein
VTRKARNGIESARKLWYRLLAPMTAAVPIVMPTRPPRVPPLTVALARDQPRSDSHTYLVHLLVMRLLLFFRKDLHDVRRTRFV